MWLLLAFGSAFFAGVTSILAKCGIKKTDSTVATAVRTIIVLIFSWIMVFVTNSNIDFTRIMPHTWLFLILSGLATGASWLCYFKALQLGNINMVVPIDKSSTILTILLALLFFQEEISPLKGAAILFIAVGTFLMIQKKESPSVSDSRGSNAAASGNEASVPDSNAAALQKKNRAWFIYALLSAVFASLTSILGKMGMQSISSNLGTAIRTGVVLLMSWLLVIVTGKAKEVRAISKKELSFICLSGIATGASWLCYYKALQNGPASVVVPVDKLSILVTIAFSYIVFHERLSKKALVGLGLIVIGTLAMIV